DRHALSIIANSRLDKTSARGASLLVRRMRDITLIDGSTRTAFRPHINADTLLRKTFPNYQDKRQRVEQLSILGQSNFIFSGREVKTESSVSLGGLLAKLVTQLFRFLPGDLVVKK